MTVADRTALIETINRLFWLTDHHRWDQLECVFADRVLLDYTSLAGGEPAELSPAEIIGGWQTTLGSLDAHQHLVGNHLFEVDGDRADATAAFQATHQFEGATWTLGGDYAFELSRADSGWLIASMTMTAVWETGDRELLTRAGEAGR